MCRMFAYHGTSVREVALLRDALVKSARHDTRHNWSHGDGHGFVIVARDSMHVYKSVRPIYEDTVDLPDVRGEFLAVFHARKASPRRIINKGSSHPYMETWERSTIIMAHNGSLKSRELMPELGIRDGSLVVDSELGLKFIVKNGLSQATIDKLKGYTRTALNLFVIELVKGDDLARLYYLNHYAGQSDPRNGHYYNLYVACLENGNAVFSSTLLDNGFSGIEAKRGSLVLFGQVRR